MSRRKREKKLDRETLKSIFLEEARRITPDSRMAMSAAEEALRRFVSLHPELVVD